MRERGRHDEKGKRLTALGYPRSKTPQVLVVSELLSSSLGDKARSVIEGELRVGKRDASRSALRSLYEEPKVGLLALKAPVPPGHDLTASLVARRETGLKPLGKKGPTGLMLKKRKGRTRRVIRTVPPNPSVENEKRQR